MINKVGDGTKEWLRFVRRWKKDNPPLDNHCYVCGICGRFVLEDEVTLDHIISRSRRPDLVLDEDNVQPAHGYCNMKKGSVYIEPVVSKEVYRFLNWLSRL